MCVCMYVSECDYVTRHLYSGLITSVVLRLTNFTTTPFFKRVAIFGQSYITTDVIKPD